MFRICATCLMILALSAGSAVGSSPSQIGLFTSEYADNCGADLVPYSPLTVFVVARLGSGLSAIVAAEFGLENVPAAGGGQMTAHWNSPLVIGGIGQGLAVAFQQPMSGPDVVLGSIDFFATSGSWIGDNRRIAIGPSPGSGKLILVDAGFSEDDDVWGGRFTFNCDSDQACACGKDGSAPATWGQVKTLFH